MKSQSEKKILKNLPFLEKGRAFAEKKGARKKGQKTSAPSRNREFKPKDPQLRKVRFKNLRVRGVNSEKTLGGKSQLFVAVKCGEGDRRLLEGKGKI